MVETVLPRISRSGLVDNLFISLFVPARLSFIQAVAAVQTTAALK
jgi:hypothetical protein